MMTESEGGGNSKTRVSIRQVKLRREKVELSPVTSSMLDVDSAAEQKQQQKSKVAPSSSSSSSHQQQQHRVGYLRLASFNARAASDTARALERMRSQGAEALVLDLRGNGEVFFSFLRVFFLLCGVPTSCFFFSALLFKPHAPDSLF